MFNSGVVAAIFGGLVAIAAGDPVLAQDVEKGRQLFRKCEACHTLAAGSGKIGPHLQNIFGRVSGAVADFSYSSAMKNAKIVWDEKSLDEYLAAPAKYVKGGGMAFPGIAKERERRHLIAFLLEATKPK